jgi:HAD superfamily hydrolase (TIGR01509 family)
MRFKAVIFDLDGVLIDSEGFQYRGWLPPLKRFGVELSKEQYFNYAGKSGSVIEAQLIEDFKLPAKKGELLEEKEKFLMQWFKEEALERKPFAEEAVKKAIEAGFKVAVCSGGPEDEILLKLKNVGLRDYFKTVVGTDAIAIGKPEPDVYLKAAKKLELAPGECVAIEDTEFGTASAKGAGMTCVAIPDEWAVKQSFEKADKICKDLEEAIEWIKEQ